MGSLSTHLEYSNFLFASHNFNGKEPIEYIKKSSEAQTFLLLRVLSLHCIPT